MKMDPHTKIKTEERRFDPLILKMIGLCPRLKRISFNDPSQTKKEKLQI